MPRCSAGDSNLALQRSAAARSGGSKNNCTSALRRIPKPCASALRTAALRCSTQRHCSAQRSAAVCAHPCYYTLFMGSFWWEDTCQQHSVQYIMGSNGWKKSKDHHSSRKKKSWWQQGLSPWLQGDRPAPKPLSHKDLLKWLYHKGENHLLIFCILSRDCSSNISQKYELGNFWEYFKRFGKWSIWVH